MAGDPPDETFKPQCLGLWVAEDGTKVVEVVQDPDGRLFTHIGRGLGQRDIGERMVTSWKPHDPKRVTSRTGYTRLDCLEVEAGWPGLGRLYQLLIARPNKDPEAFDGLPWVHVDPDTPREEIRLFPQTGASFLDAVTWQEDEGYIEWAEPFSTYRPATEEELRTHEASLRD